MSHGYGWNIEKLVWLAAQAQVGAVAVVENQLPEKGKISVARARQVKSNRLRVRVKELREDQ